MFAITSLLAAPSTVAPAAPLADGSSTAVLLPVGLGLLAVAGGCLFVLFHLLARARQLDERLGRLDLLRKLDGSLQRMIETQQDLDLRRLEHVLIDIRDGQKRVEERLLAVLEAKSKGEPWPQTEGSPKAGGAALADRVVSRLLALGYERIDLLTPAEEVAALTEGDGEILVEARRSGAPHKGKVVVHEGGIADVQVRASYEMFP